MPSLRQSRDFYSLIAIGFPVLLLMITTVSTLGCRGPATEAGGPEVLLEVVTDKAVGDATVEVTLLAAGGDPIEDATVLVRGDMNHAGMKLVFSEAKSTGGGRYRTEDFTFTMGGDWILTAEVTLPDGQRLERSVNVDGVRGR
ncbi:MAG: FixH family protein [Chloroflexota bacterium]